MQEEKAECRPRDWRDGKEIQANEYVSLTLSKGHQAGRRHQAPGHTPAHSRHTQAGTGTHTGRSAHREVSTQGQRQTHTHRQSGKGESENRGLWPQRPCLYKTHTQVTPTSQNCWYFTELFPFGFPQTSGDNYFVLTHSPLHVQC